MALWHFMQGDNAYSWTEDGGLVSSFDDGLDLIPGEDEFSSSAADTKASGFDETPVVTAVYTGTPGYAARIAAEAQAAQEAQDLADAKAAADAQTLRDAQAAADAKAEAEAVIDALLNPPSPLGQLKAQVNAQYDALLAAAPDRAADIAKLRATALADPEIITTE